MQIIRKTQLRGSSRHVENAVYETTRFLVAADGAGVSVTDITLAPGIEETYGYAAHQEIAYCLEGEAVATELETGIAHRIEPGTMWVARPGEYFRFLASRPTRLICVFTPPLDGGENGFAPGPVQSADA